MNRAAQMLGRLGGKSKSAAKAAAAKENGKRGGRPKKPKNELLVQKLRAAGETST